jgi:hypothetical protein
MKLAPLRTTISCESFSILAWDRLKFDLSRHSLDRPHRTLQALQVKFTMPTIHRVQTRKREIIQIRLQTSP